MRSIDRFVTDEERGRYVEGEFFDSAEKGIPGVRKVFNSANILEVTACTTGFRGGDAGHGGRTIVRFKDLGGTCIKVFPLCEEYGNGGVEIVLGGDTELITMIDGLRFAADTLEKLMNKAK